MRGEFRMKATAFIPAIFSRGCCSQESDSRVDRDLSEHVLCVPNECARTVALEYHVVQGCGRAPDSVPCNGVRQSEYETH